MRFATPRYRSPMPNVDAFFQFVVEELNKEGISGVRLGLIQARWYGNFDGAVEMHEGASLTELLNKISKSCDFTSKDLRVTEEPSVVKRTIELASERSALLHVTLSDHPPGWVAKVSGMPRVVREHDLQTCLINTMDNIFGETND